MEKEKERGAYWYHTEIIIWTDGIIIVYQKNQNECTKFDIFC